MMSRFSKSPRFAVERSSCAVSEGGDEARRLIPPVVDTV
jgi:hypothetical protein